ncbi:hypothetical protein P4S95_23545 [Aneurinibacillus aneurinilyticus]|uniref:hypothetical protein n=1 Tax=Aneurinibacillus aneurinilyticus TaxID=1391 RepID=UPI002E1B05F7|nr:hypothetical protein [Aneurinibacillus aneurinilyticus]
MKVSTKVKSKGSVNKHLIKIWKNYKKFSTNDERRFDILVPVILSMILVLICGLLIHKTTDLITILKEFNSAALTVLAILAGFNTTSLSVIAASNPTFLGKLYGSNRNKANNEKSNLLEQTISFFGYAILIQISLLIFGAVMVFVLGSIAYSQFIINFEVYTKITLTIITWPWISTVFHSLFISIRNIALLYGYVMLIGQSNQDKNENSL